MNEELYALSDREYFDKVFSQDFSQELIHDMGCSDQENILEALNDSLFSAINEYVEGSILKNNYVPDHAESKALLKVNKKAAELYDALMELIDHGQSQTRLAQEINDFKSRFEPGSTPAILSTLAKPNASHTHQLIDIRDLITDLGIAAENAANPKPDNHEEIEYWSIHAKERYKQRKKDHKLPADHPLRCFIKAFKPFWDTHTNHPFTEGRNEASQGETTSIAVDVIEKIAQKLNSKIDRPSIVTCIKNMRKEGEIVGVRAR